MNARVLLIDDSRFSRRLAREILESAGFQVEEAADAYRALELYPAIRPDVVLLDVLMEPMSGLDLLPLLLELDPDARVIAATADVQTQTAQALEKAGVLRVMNKPFNREQILSNVSAVLQGRPRFSQ